MEELTTIQSKIYEIRGQRVMLDFDLAALYQVTTSALNQAVKRNIERFPEEFMFRISEIEWKNMSSQFVTTSRVKRPKTSLPYAFTEQGVAMLSAVLRSGMAIQVSISIMKAFVAMRNYITTATTVTSELAEIRAKLALLERADDPDRRCQLRDRIRMLSAMLREARELAVLTEHYYDRGYRRNAKYTL